MLTNYRKRGLREVKMRVWTIGGRNSFANGFFGNTPSCSEKIMVAEWSYSLLPKRIVLDFDERSPFSPFNFDKPNPTTLHFNASFVKGYWINQEFSSLFFRKHINGVNTPLATQLDFKLSKNIECSRDKILVTSFGNNCSSLLSVDHFIG